MILDGDHQRAMEATDEKRESRIVFIGRNLPRGEDPQGLRELRGVIRDAASMSRRPARSPTSPPSSTARRSRSTAGAPVVGGAFPRRHAPCSCSARRRCCSSPPTAPSSASRCTAAASSSAASDGARIVTGGDDGKVVATDADGRARDARDRRQAPLDRSRRARAGRRGRLVGRQAGLRAHRQGRGEVARTALERRRPRLRAEGLAARGRALQRRDALVSRTPQADARDARLEGLASRRDVQPGRALPRHLDAGADAARLAPRRRARTCACRAIRRKVRSLAWTADGKWLATSGSEQLILWPFEGKDGPMGKAPRECGARPARCTRVAFHPKA